ncbi:MAG: hypothetical protein ABSE75_07505, partial [Acidimicrobiales bacterium]
MRNSVTRRATKPIAAVAIGLATMMSSSLVAVEPATAAAAANSFELPDAVTLSSGNVWVANPAGPSGQGSVTELNASDGSLVQVINSSADGFVEPDAIAVSGGDVWVANGGWGQGGSITELNASD